MHLELDECIWNLFWCVSKLKTPPRKSKFEIRMSSKPISNLLVTKEAKFKIKRACLKFSTHFKLTNCSCSFVMFSNLTCASFAQNRWCVCGCWGGGGGGGGCWTKPLPNQSLHSIEFQMVKNHLELNLSILNSTFLSM